MSFHNIIWSHVPMPTTLSLYWSQSRKSKQKQIWLCLLHLLKCLHRRLNSDHPWNNGLGLPFEQLSIFILRVKFCCFSILCYTSMYMDVYMFACTYICVCPYIHIYIYMEILLRVVFTMFQYIFEPRQPKILI